MENNSRRLIPRIGGHHDGIPYEVLEGKDPPPYLGCVVYDGTWLGVSVPVYYQLRTTVRWDKDINFYYVQEYVYIGRNFPPKEEATP